jgi:prepilin-type N-terminal cleavage/methylation domain-containing protein
VKHTTPRNTKTKKKRGFTLIELLVVISIISLLSTIVLASLNTAREKAKDSATLQNIKQLKLAMELYNNDNGFYPGQDGSLTSCYGEYCAYSLDSFSDIENALSPYLSNIKFINNSFVDIGGYDSYYLFDIEAWAGPSGEYSCDGTETYTEYVFGFPKYDKAGREINLPFPKDINGSFYGPDYYCIGV